MPARPSANVATIYLEVDPALKARLQTLADASGRTLKAECVLGLERHLAYPPPPPEKPALPSLPGGAAAEQPKRGRPPGKAKGK